MSKKSDKYQWLREWQDDGEDRSFSAKRMRYEADSKNLEMSALMPVKRVRDRCDELLDPKGSTKDNKIEEPKPAPKQVETLSAEQAQNLLEEGIQEDDLENMVLAVESGAKFDVQGPNGMEPLMEAVDRANRKAVRLLVKLGADVNVMNPDRSSALGLAIMNGDKDIVSDLIELGANVNNANKLGETPLMEALYCHASLPIIQLLLDKGANPFYMCKQTKDTPMKLAMEDNREEVRTLFRIYEAFASNRNEFVKRGVIQEAVFKDPRKFMN